MSRPPPPATRQRRLLSLRHARCVLATLIVLLCCTHAASAGLQGDLDAACARTATNSVARYSFGPLHGAKGFYCYKHALLDFRAFSASCVSNIGNCYYCYGEPVLFPEDDVFEIDGLDTILANYGVQNLTCFVEGLQHHLDATCFDLDPSQPVARFDVGSGSDTTLKWRCYSGDAIDFTMDGWCVHGNGRCVLCNGAVNQLGGSYVTRDDLLREVIANHTGLSITSTPTCTPTPQQSINHICRERDASKPYARYGSDLRHNDTWRCFGEDELDFGSLGRCWDSSDSQCNECYGSPLPFPRSCKELRQRGVSEDGFYDILIPSGDVVQARCFFYDSGDEIGGHTAIPCDRLSTGGCRATKAYTDRDTCADFGLQPLIIRTREHFFRVTASFAPVYFRAGVGVYGINPGFAPNECSMHYPSYGDGDYPCSGWRALDGGNYFLKSQPISEPNGDYEDGCWLGTRLDRESNPYQFDWVNDWDCTYETSTYLCSTNDFETGDPGAQPPPLKDGSRAQATYEETQLIEAVLGSDAACAKSLQDQVNDLCASLHPTAPIARFAEGDVGDRLPKWRCFDANTISFNVPGTCVADDGSCVECDGDHIHGGQLHFDEHDAITEYIEQQTGASAAECTPSLQHQLNHYCAVNVAGTAFARIHVARTSLSESVLQCFPRALFTFGVYEKACVGEDGACTTCRGGPVATAPFTFDHHEALANIIKTVSGNPFTCSLQDQLDDLCEEATGLPFARFGPSTRSRPNDLAWRCYASSIITTAVPGTCVTDRGQCADCEGGISPNGTIMAQTPPNEMLERTITSLSGRDFACDSVFRVGSLWALRTATGAHAGRLVAVDGIGLGFFVLRDGGVFESNFGSGNWTVAPSAPKTLTLTTHDVAIAFAYNADKRILEVVSAYAPFISLDVVDGQVSSEGSEADLVFNDDTSFPPQIVSGPDGKQDGLAFNGNNGMRVSTPQGGIELNSEWTIDFLALFPIPNTGRHHVLVSNARSALVAVDRGSAELGSFSGGLFVSSGVDTTKLSRGWHRITVIKGQGGQIQFYIDGELSGAHNARVLDAVTTLGNYGYAHPFGTMARLRIYNEALPAFALAGTYAIKSDTLTSDPLFSFSAYTHWDLVAPGRDVRSFVLYPDGTGSADWGATEWSRRADGTFSFTLSGDTVNVVLVDRFTFIGIDTASDNDVTLYGRMRAKYFEEIGVTTIDTTAEDFPGKVGLKMWGAGGGGTNAGAGAFVGGAIATKTYSTLTIEVGEPSAFQGSSYPFDRCNGGGRTSVYANRSPQNELLVAAGGGGGYAGHRRGGAGGAEVGEAAESACAGARGVCSEGATGGTQRAGGRGGICTPTFNNYDGDGFPGSRIYGGTGTPNNVIQGCPGGNGYYGGGMGCASANHLGGGGGGSSFVSRDSSVAGFAIAGHLDAPGNADDIYRSRLNLPSQAGNVQSLRGKAVLLFRSSEIASLETAAFHTQALAAGTTWMLTSLLPAKPSDTPLTLSLALLGMGRCEWFTGLQHRQCSYAVTVDGAATVTLGTSVFDVAFPTQNAAMFTLSLNGGAATYNATLVESDSSAHGALFGEPGTFTYAVPAGVSEVSVFMFGGSGQGSFGGAGGFVSGDIRNLIPGDSFTIEIGDVVTSQGQGTSGGGRTAVLRGENELMVAGGGGGSGSTRRLAGGGGGTDFSSTVAQASGYIACMSDDDAACTTRRAQGGSDSRGGLAGIVPDPTEDEASYTTMGTDGDRKVGGRGVLGATVQGGVGGAGYYGGGSGGANNLVRQGGGGGSSFLNTLLVVNGVMVAANTTTRHDATLPFTTSAGRGGNIGMVYVRAHCPEGTTSFHTLGVSPCIPCPNGTYVPPGSIGSCSAFLCPTGTYDHDGDSSTQCVPCPSGRFSPIEGATICLPVSPCDDGFGMSSAPTASSDRVCQACVEGATFSTAVDGVNVCANVSMCSGGSMESAAPTTSSDRMCNVCPKDTFAQDNRCLNATVCQEGSYVTTPPTTTTDRACSNCPQGSFSNTLNAGECTQHQVCDFESGFFELLKPSRFSDRVCRPITACQTGLFEQAAPTETSDRVCSPCTQCPDGDVTEPCTPTMDTVCTLCRPCGAGNYTLASCTVTEQATCAVCDVCSDVQYQQQPCLTNANTVCMNLTNCDASSQFEIVKPTRFSDRVCSALSVCTESEYELVAPTATTNRVCRAASTCPSGSFVSVPATATSDRECSRCPPGTVDHDNDYTSPCQPCDPGTFAPEGSLVCTPCAAGTSDDDRNPATPCTRCDGIFTFQPHTQQVACERVSVCGPGLEEAVEPTPFSDRQCRTCVDGVSFKATSGQDTLCQPVRTCGLGFGETTEPTTSSDRICEPCVASETYSDSDLPFSTCQQVTECAEDEFELQQPTRASNRVCRKLAQCEEGLTYEVVAATATSNRVCLECTECPGVTTAACTLTEDAVCEDCGSCSASQYINASCTATAPVQCSDCSECADNEYVLSRCLGRQDTRCAQLTRCDPLGEYELTPPAADRDRVCAALTICTDSEYEASEATASTDRVCLPVSGACPEGMYQSKGATDTADRECMPLSTCSSNMYESSPATATSDRVCMMVTECDDDEFELMPESPSADRVCEKCLTGCPEGEVLTGSCTRASGPTCEPCPLPDDCDDNSFLEGFCIHDFRPTCTACRSCALRTEYEIVPCTRTSNRACATLTECQDGEYERVRPTVTTNRVCNVFSRECAATEYETRAPTPVNDRVCMPLTTCGSAEYEAYPPTASTNRICQLQTVCTQDEFEARAPTATSDRLCDRISVCAETEYIHTPASLTSDVDCEPTSKLETAVIVFDLDFATVIDETTPTTLVDHNDVAFWLGTVPDNFLEVVVARLRTGYSVTERISISVSAGSIAAEITTPSSLDDVRYDANRQLFTVMFDGARVNGKGREQIDAEAAATQAYLERQTDVAIGNSARYLAVYNAYLAAGGVMTLFDDFYAALYDQYPPATPAPSRSSALDQPGAVAGLVVGILVILVIIVAAAVIIKRKRGGKSSLQGSDGRAVAFSNPIYATKGPTGRPMDMYGMGELDDTDGMSYEEPDYNSGYDHIDASNDPDLDDTGYLDVHASSSPPS